MPTVPTHFVSAPCSPARHWGVRAFGPARILFIFQQKTCCERLTNCHGTVPSTPATDVSAGWWLMKISWKTSIGLSSGGPPWFIMPAFMPEATGSTLSASTDPCKLLACAGLKGSLFMRLVCYWHIFYLVTANWLHTVVIVFFFSLLRFAFNDIHLLLEQLTVVSSCSLSRKTVV